MIADELYFTFWADPNSTMTLSENDPTHILSEAKRKYEENSKP